MYDKYEFLILRSKLRRLTDGSSETFTTLRYVLQAPPSYPRVSRILAHVSNHAPRLLFEIHGE